MSVPKIDDYSFGRITVEGSTYTSDLIILPDRIEPDWWRTSGHNLDVDDLRLVLHKPPDVLVIGQGAYGRMIVPQASLRALEDAGIEVVALPTAEAVQRYNELCETRSTAAALHLTC